jgi:hypothetical protein
MSNQEYDNEGRGVLFANKERTKDSQPQAKGSCQLDGVEYWVSAWTQTSKAGVKYQSLSFQRKDEVQARGMEQAKAASIGQRQSGADYNEQIRDFDDDIPF